MKRGEQVKRKIIITLSILFSLWMIGLFIFYLMKHDHTRWQVALGGILISLPPLSLLKMKKIRLIFLLLLVIISFYFVPYI